jgi:3',5'-cyclic AMP phosphodiesterase CpdA
VQTNTIAILHLSDFHFKTSSNPISSRTSAIAAAVRAECSQLRACAIAITGDIAFSGLREEYDQALAFLESLRTALQTDHPSASIIFAAVPGNHDCDLSGPSELRELTIANIEPKLDSLSPDGEIATMCLGAQKTFFAFLNPIPVS